VYTPALRTRRIAKPVKPPALAPGDLLRAISPASPAPADAISRGASELERLGYRVRFTSPEMKPEGYFAGTLARRTAELSAALADAEARAIVCVRGGYGSGTLLAGLRLPRRARPKLVIGYSDITMLHAFLWRRFRWTSLYGPMVVGGFDRGAEQPAGYDRSSFLDAVGGAQRSWSIGLDGEALFRGEATGIVLGGCLTLLQSCIGTPWDLDTRGAILLLEDRAVKPYQLDRKLLHLAQAGKFGRVRGVVLGEFPDSEPPAGSSVTMRDVCRRVFGAMGIPVVFGAAIGHTPRPMLTIPLGVRGRLISSGAGKLEILETAVVPTK
jgi:muramoyltetrapeptide carboxypeptidase